jgi:hypothetical protein
MLVAGIVFARTQVGHVTLGNKVDHPLDELTQSRDESQEQPDDEKDPGSLSKGAPHLDGVYTKAGDSQPDLAERMVAPSAQTRRMLCLSP